LISWKRTVSGCKIPIWDSSTYVIGDARTGAAADGAKLNVLTRKLYNVIENAYAVPTNKHNSAAIPMPMRIFLMVSRLLSSNYAPEDYSEHGILYYFAEITNPEMA
jgi:hypothetical protein